MKNKMKRNIRKKIICILLMIAVASSALLMAACTKEDETGNANETETTVRAADPMTEEEMEADDTDGCIEDAEDTLY